MLNRILNRTFSKLYMEDVFFAASMMHFISLWAMLVVHTSIQIMIYWPVRHCWQPSSQVTQSSWSETAASPIQEQASHHESAELVLITWKRKMHDTDVHDNQMMSVLACVRESKMTPAEAVCVHTVACGSPGGQRTGPVYTCLPTNDKNFGSPTVSFLVLFQSDFCRQARRIFDCDNNLWRRLDKQQWVSWEAKQHP